MTLDQALQLRHTPDNHIAFSRNRTFTANGRTVADNDQHHDTIELVRHTHNRPAAHQPEPALSSRVVPHFVDVIGVQYLGPCETFDIEVAQQHNFVADGIVVHNSGRYVEVQDEFYVPELWRAQSASNKQGSAGPLEEQASAAAAYQQGLAATYAAYQRLRELGVAKEQARVVLPQSIYTQWIWTGSLQAFLHVVDLRTKPDAQWETQQYGLAVRTIIAQYFPVCLEKWEQRKH
jgi:hypothetical protein